MRPRCSPSLPDRVLVFRRPKTCLRMLVIATCFWIFHRTFSRTNKTSRRRGKQPLTTDAWTDRRRDKMGFLATVGHGLRVHRAVCSTINHTPYHHGVPQPPSFARPYKFN